MQQKAERTEYITFCADHLKAECRFCALGLLWFYVSDLNLPTNAHISYTVCFILNFTASV